MSDTARERAEGKIDIAIQRLADKYPFHAKILEQFTILSRPSDMFIRFRFTANG